VVLNADPEYFLPGYDTTLKIKIERNRKYENIKKANLACCLPRPSVRLAAASTILNHDTISSSVANLQFGVPNGVSCNAVFRIRIQIRKVLGLPDPDPLVRGTDPDPLITSKKSKKPLGFYLL
jgi:hypothetical protein